jgi:hypothetical protein
VTGKSETSVVTPRIAAWDGSAVGKNAVAVR